METQKFDFFLQKSSKFEFWLLTKSWNHLSFVNISPTLVIDTSMEWSSIFMSTTPWKPRNVNIFKKVRNWRNWILSVPRVSVCREKKSPWLRQYQSYISNWYVNGKVFTSTTTWEPIFFFFFKKVRNWIRLFFVCRHVSIWGFQNRFRLSVRLSVCLSFHLSVSRKRNHHSFVNISPTLAIETSMERSSQVLHHENQKIWISSKKFEIRFWLAAKSWNHHSFVNIKPTLVIDTSMERSLRVLQHTYIETPKLELFSKKFEIEFWLVF